MKRLHENFEETLERLLGQRLDPSVAMESRINRVWERLQSEIVETSADMVSERLAVRRNLTLPKIGFVVGTATAAIAPALALFARFMRNLWHGSPSADE